MEPPTVYLTSSCCLRGRHIPKPISTEEEDRDVYNFLGIPYAEPPVGKLRFCDPKPISPWSGVRSATEFGAVCPQDFSVLQVKPFTLPQPNLVSEDCLFLNIWTPSLDGESRLPVMVWIHGGDFLSGFSDQYDMKALACFHNVVVVTFNYRLGPFGFLSMNDDSATGNYGILDQIEVLKWIQKYISHFGGDKENVTIFGEGSGGVCVTLLIISPLAKGLFRRAIAQSGTVFSGDLGGRTMENAFSKTRGHMTKAMAACPPAATTSGSEIVGYLRKLSAEELVTAFKGHQFTPVIDGRVFTGNTTEAYERGEFNDCELITGCNTDEGEMVHDLYVKKLLLPGELLSVKVARTVLTHVVGLMWTVPNGENVYRAIVDQYVGEDDVHTHQELRKLMAECFGDMMFVFPTIRAAECHSRKCKTFVYQYRHRTPGENKNYPEYVRALHGFEIFYTLRMHGFEIPFKKEDMQLTRQIATYWTNFAKTGNPNGDGLAEWPDYDETSKKHMILDVQSKKGAKLKESRAAFWLNKLPKTLSNSA